MKDYDSRSTIRETESQFSVGSPKANAVGCEPPAIVIESDRLPKDKGHCPQRPRDLDMSVFVETESGSNGRHVTSECHEVGRCPNGSCQTNGDVQSPNGVNCCQNDQIASEVSSPEKCPTGECCENGLDGVNGENCENGVNGSNGSEGHQCADGQRRSSETRESSSADTVVAVEAVSEARPALDSKQTESGHKQIECPQSKSVSARLLAEPKIAATFGSTASISVDFDDMSTCGDTIDELPAAAANRVQICRRGLRSDDDDNGSIRAPAMRRHQSAAERHKQKVAKARERRATLIVGLIMGSFIAAWSPFFVLYVLAAVCAPCKPGAHIPEGLFAVAFWLGYCNSAANPIICECS